MKPLTPPEIVAQLDRSIVGQERAKRDLAVAIRNRWRAQQTCLCAREDAAERRYLISGPRGSGKSALLRLAAQTIDVPFTSVSALQLVGPGAPERALEELLGSLIESVLPRFETQEAAVDHVSASAMIAIDGVDRLYPAGPPDDGRDDRLEAAQQAFQLLLSAPSFNTRFGEIPVGNILMFAASQTPAARLGEPWPDLSALFPRRIELDSLTDDDLRAILANEHASPIQHYLALLATEGLTLRFTHDALEAIAAEAGEQDRKTDDIGARRLSTVIEWVLDDLLFDPSSAPGADVTIDAGYVSARTTVDGDDEDLADFIL